MNTIKFGDISNKASFGDMVELQNQTQEVVRCQESDVLMLNIDADQLRTGDLTFIKALGLTISNPETEDPIALGVEVRKQFGRKLADWFESDNDNDSDFFSSSSSSDDDDNDSGSGWGSFGGSSSFGGFGGGSFSGGGASGSF